MLADIFSMVSGSPFVSFIVGAIVAGTIYILIGQVHDRITKDFVRKSELQAALQVFEQSLLTKLVTTDDLKVFKGEQHIAIEQAAKETRHQLKNDLNAIQISVTGELHELKTQAQKVEVALARVDEHFKHQETKTATT